MKKIAILGSTGSIGTQTIDILPSIDAQVTALTTNKRIGLLETQARALRPKMVCAFDEAAARDLVAAREGGREFISIEELSMACPKLSQAHIEQLKSVGALNSLPDESQMSFF